ncbi:DNA repair protein RecO [Alloscardovia criceti]|uniref:DNA repair protein RecO n=1 Tax=Alloscardovia criceti TaxID=356828 RepID=UPI000376C855|nr:DNA repair protein RecO [Alloscardovia criceti]
MPSYTDEGVVLRTAKLGEADKIITILTPEHGKIRAVAKGVRRTKSRFGGRLEPFSRNKFLIFEGRGELQHINQAESLVSYGSSFVEDYDCYIAANVMVEAVDKLLDSAIDMMPSDVRAYYRLLISALASLSRKEHRAEVIENSFLLRLLATGGWSPHLDNCEVCGRQTDLNFFSVQAGGMMCSTDRLLDAREISHESRVQLFALLKGRWDLLPETTGKQVLNPDVPEIVEDWLQYYVERPIRSLKLVKSVL